MEYLNPSLLSRAKLRCLEERNDFPGSEQVIPKLNYPTYLIMKLQKNKKMPHVSDIDYQQNL